MLQEAESQQLRDFVSPLTRWTFSVLTRIEATRTLRRRTAPADFAQRLATVLADGDFLPISDPIVESACRLDPPVLRSLDAIHLASALLLGDELEGIVTYDRRLANAARELGVPVFSPGQPQLEGT